MFHGCLPLAVYELSGLDLDDVAAVFRCVLSKLCVFCEELFLLARIVATVARYLGDVLLRRFTAMITAIALVVVDRTITRLVCTFPRICHISFSLFLLMIPRVLIRTGAKCFIAIRLLN